MDYLGFFTNSTSLLASLIFIACGVVGIRGLRRPSWLDEQRAVAVSCVILVGVGYNVLPGVGTAPGWVSTLLHAVVPIVVTLDWVLVGDRPMLPLRRLWLVLPYPLLWLAMIQYRWATDQWVPYWYMHPSQGALSLSLRIGAVLAGLFVAAGAVWMASRYRLSAGAVSFPASSPISVPLPSFPSLPSLPSLGPAPAPATSPTGVLSAVPSPSVSSSRSSIPAL